MRTVISGEEFDHALATFDRVAFRLEQQPSYAVSYEADNVAAFLAGDPRPPETVPDLAAWFATVRRHAAAGRVMTRVRVHDQPPTDYQRWIQWLEPWNIAAGEHIIHAERAHARAAGVTVDLGDFWLLDDARVILMAFDEHGMRTHALLTDEPDHISRARRLRDHALAAAGGPPRAV